MQSQSMIEINLLPGKKKKKAGAGVSMPDFSEVAGKIRDPLMIAAVGVWVIVLPVVGYTYFNEGRKLAELTDEVERVTIQARNFNTLIREKQTLESLRDSLVVELAAIREIDADRYIWPHIMEEVTKALPDFTWLNSLEFVPAATPDVTEEADPNVRLPVQFTIDGRTGDMGAYTRFLRNLGNSPWIANVQAGATQTVLESDRPVIAFTITGTYQQADSAFIRTVPLQESVR
ncbi:MAG: PilN domain-containing protein [Gemmatimonadota bacterium]|nr:MAG: PilN domain-containing protein [Gemmatimonadota bacterium]